MNKPQETTTLRIGELARLADMSVEAVRYYEDRGLVDQAERDPASRYRLFHSSAVNQLRFVRRTQRLGFTLTEIRELAELGTSTSGRAVDVRDVVGQKLCDVREKISDLRRIEKSLKELSNACNGRGSVRECVILNALKDPHLTDG